jgi:hypothetical protein
MTYLHVALILALGLLTPRAAAAQRTVRVWRIGFISVTYREDVEDAFFRRLGEFG